MTEPKSRPSVSELLGGWDDRSARVVRVFVDGDIALALVDSNGDGARVMLEPWEREGSRWMSTGFSTSFGADNAGRIGGIVFAAGEARPRAIVTVAFGDAMHEVLADDEGLWGWVGRDDSLVIDLPRHV
jgi:hypothetical protein